MKNLKPIEQFLLLFLGSLVAISAYVHFVPFGLSWNMTKSIPQGLYLSTRTDGATLFHRGQIACFEYAPPQWASPRRYFPPGFQLCKHVLGLPGDAVTLAEGSVSISSAAGVFSGGTYAKADSAGRPLPQDVGISGVLGSTEYLLLAPANSNSLDSRYLGRIERRQITRTLVPLMTW
jgi:conjugative transfer signal peptidase TraF